MDDILLKKDAVITLYGKNDGEYFFEVTIQKDYVDFIGGNFHGKWLEFQPELDILNIRDEGDEYIYYGSLNQEQLKKKLEIRDFKVIYEK